MQGEILTCRTRTVARWNTSGNGSVQRITGSIEANIHCDEKLGPSDIDCHKSAGNKRQKQARAACKLENIALQHINLHLLPSVAHSSQAPSPLLGQQSILVLQLG